MKREIAPGKCEPPTAPHVTEIQPTLVLKSAQPGSLRPLHVLRLPTDRTLAKGLSHHVGMLAEP